MKIIYLSNLSEKLKLLFLAFLFLQPYFALSVKSVAVHPAFQKQKASTNFREKPNQKRKFGERLMISILKKKLKKSKKRERTLANDAFWLSIAGFIPFVGILFGLAGFITGIISLFQTKRVKNKIKHVTFAYFAIILGLATLVGNYFLWLILLFFRPD